MLFKTNLIKSSEYYLDSLFEYIFVLMFAGVYNNNIMTYKVMNIITYLLVIKLTITQKYII